MGKIKSVQLIVMLCPSNPSSAMLSSNNTLNPCLAVPQYLQADVAAVVERCCHYVNIRGSLLEADSRSSLENGMSPFWLSKAKIQQNCKFCWSLFAYIFFFSSKDFYGAFRSSPPPLLRYYFPSKNKLKKIFGVLRPFPRF